MSIVDTVYTYKFIKLLTTPWKEQDAYKLGIIDDKGKVLRSARTLKKQEEKDSYTSFHRLAWNIKRIVQKMPGGSSKFANYASALFLIKEQRNTEGVSDMHINLFEQALKNRLDEEPTNVIGDAGENPNIATYDPKLGNKVKRRKKKESKDDEYEKRKRETPALTNESLSIGYMAGPIRTDYESVHVYGLGPGQQEIAKIHFDGGILNGYGQGKATIKFSGLMKSHGTKKVANRAAAVKHIEKLLTLKEDMEQLDESDVAGWIAIYNGKKLEIVKGKDAKDLYSAKQFAIKQLKVPKSKQGLLAIKPAYNESRSFEAEQLDEAAYTKYSNELKKWIEKESGFKVKKQVINGKKPDPNIRFVPTNWQKGDKFPNSLRMKAVKAVYGGKIPSGLRDSDNIDYGNITDNGITMKVSQWKNAFKDTVSESCCDTTFDIIKEAMKRRKKRDASGKIQKFYKRTGDCPPGKVKDRSGGCVKIGGSQSLQQIKKNRKVAQKKRKKTLKKKGKSFWKIADMRRKKTNRA